MLSSTTKLLAAVEVPFVAQLILLIGRGAGGCGEGRRYEIPCLGGD